jgi:hypothetical protein
VILAPASAGVPPQPEPATAPPGLAAPDRRRHELVRERRRLPVPRHLPAQRAGLRDRDCRHRDRDLVRPATRDRRRSRARDRQAGRPACARRGLDSAVCGLRAAAARPLAVARICAACDRGDRERWLLAEPVDTDLAPDAARATARGLLRSSASR